MPENSWKPIAEIAQDVSSGKISAISLVKKSLSIIKEKQDYKAIISILEDSALKRAEIVDSQAKAGKKIGRLAGVPFIAKDNFLVFGADTTAASNILRGFRAPYQATVINKLETEGAICVAKANLDAFAHGSSTENSDFFTTLNPHDKSRVPGGSSGGSAAAVALDMAPFALGTDTGGSIRQPASFCGIVGYKPTYGLVSRNGVIAMGSSLDVIGPLTKTVEDAALVFDVMAGKDKFDMTLIDRDEEPYTDFSARLKGAKIGVIKQYMDDNVDHEIISKTNEIIEKVKSAGAEIKSVELPSSNLSLPVYYIICPAELSSNLSRYDGQRYGHFSLKAKDLDDSYTKSRSSGFGDEAKRRIMIGTHVLSSGYYDAYYKKAQIVRTKIINEVNEAFEEVDFLVGPTAPSTAFKIGEKSGDPIQMYLSDLLTVTANLAGTPAINLPAGQVDSLPVGFQIMAAQGKDRQLFSISKEVEELVR